MVLSSTQNLTKMDTVDISLLWGWGSKGSRCVGLKILPPSCDDGLEFLEAWTSSSPNCLSRPVQGWRICGEMVDRSWILAVILKARGNSAGCIYWGADKSLPRQRRKQAQNHVRDARDFNKIETRAVIKYIFYSCKARSRRNFTPFWEKH